MPSRTCRAITFALGLAVAASVHAGSPGDLFPSVSYDQVVQTPRIAPKATPALPVTTPPVTTPPTVKPPTPANPTEVKPDHTTPDTPTTTPPQPALDQAGAAHFWSPYSASLLVPLISNDLKSQFDQRWSDVLSSAKDDSKRVAAADLLAGAAGPDKVVDASLRRYILLNALSLAVQGRAPLTTRQNLANQFLPLIENDPTLPAAQAKADAIEALAMSAPSSAPASPKLLDLVTEAFSDLALAQVQVGFPSQAEESLKKARAWVIKIGKPSADRLAQLYGVQYWLARSQAAKLLAPKLKATLTDKPDDPSTNTQLATLHLSLFADLSSGAACAAKSDKAEFQAFGKLVASMDGGVEAVDPATPKGFASSLDICRVLMNLTPACTDTFDRFAIATYVDDRLEELLAKYKPTGDSRSLVQGMQTRAQAIMDANKPPLPLEIQQQLARDAAAAAASASDTTNTNPNNPNTNPQPRKFGGFGGFGRGGGRGGRG